MVSLRFSSSMFVVLCILHIISYSSAHALQGDSKSLTPESKMHEKGFFVIKDSVASIQEEPVDEVPNAARKMKFGGRKMGLKAEMEKVEGLNGKTSQISGGKKGLIVNFGISGVKSSITNKLSVAVAFGADYHGPTHHPPQHN